MPRIMPSTAIFDGVALYTSYEKNVRSRPIRVLLYTCIYGNNENIDQLQVARKLYFGSFEESYEQH